MYTASSLVLFIIQFPTGQQFDLTWLKFIRFCFILFYVFPAWQPSTQPSSRPTGFTNNGAAIYTTAATGHYYTLPYLTLPYLTLPYLTLPYLTLPYLTLPYLALACNRYLCSFFISHFLPFLCPLLFNFLYFVSLLLLLLLDFSTGRKNKKPFYLNMTYNEATLHNILLRTIAWCSIT